MIVEWKLTLVPTMSQILSFLMSTSRQQLLSTNFILAVNQAVKNFHPYSYALQPLTGSISCTQGNLAVQLSEPRGN